tara:strand:+ start:78 stop:458 length:381 start_codon:yes stop_codon:yes gene_type:complete
MARTKLSRGKEPFQMRSGNSTPYPFLGGVGKALGKVGKALTGGIGRKIMGQRSGAEMQEKDNQQMLAEMHAAIVGDEGDTMMTKKTHMYHTVDAHGKKHGHKEPGYPTSYTETVTEGPFPEKNNNK